MDNDESRASAVRKMSRTQTLEGQEYAESKLAEVLRQRKFKSGHAKYWDMHSRRRSARCINHNCSLVVACTSRRCQRKFIVDSELHSAQSYAHTVKHTVPYDAYNRMIVLVIIRKMRTLSIPGTSASSLLQVEGKWPPKPQSQGA
jgi:hypothetical protein